MSPRSWTATAGPVDCSEPGAGSARVPTGVIFKGQRDAYVNGLDGGRQGRQARSQSCRLAAEPRPQWPCHDAIHRPSRRL